eukprot:CAMPEP_0116872394 /NCGR_PEP_ID=MMETSP0463-20121206/3143_1 /TAXON_ID=181622 /ORGANISM="Strombidinopsis sp, Strain SopsisLIS2011" /LENGTH=48 /DNA_ID= /DNA_START= /DNA_END= /DNA_ORIENTATION=
MPLAVTSIVAFRKNNEYSAYESDTDSSSSSTDEESNETTYSSDFASPR